MKKASDLFKEISDKKLKEDLSTNSGLFLFKYSGVSSADLTQLRNELKNAKARMFITKNNFINLALKVSIKSNDIMSFVNGPTALVFIKDDPVGPSKVLTNFAKTHETIELKGGFIKERVIYPKDFKILANIPSRQILYQQIVMVFNSPVSKLAIGLNQIITKIAYALKAVSDKKQK